MYDFLDHIHTPQDLKKLSRQELPKLAEEIRAYIREFTGHTGGHIGSGMGVVELTIALHYLFEFEKKDALILDVGHQCYPHKILTGRRSQMFTIRQKGGLSGFPDPKESAYDRVKVGHGGTSLTTALGMAVGFQNEGYNDKRKIVALIGDGALQEGVALEALNHGGSFDKLPLLMVLNDNEHGIGPAVGALSKYFSKVRAGTIYRHARDNVKRLLDSMERQVPSVGRLAKDVVKHVKTSMHGLLPAVHPGILFEELGYFYYGPIDGHDLPTLLEALEDCKRLEQPVVLHCITEKGRGYAQEDDRLGYHAGKPSKSITNGIPKEFSIQGGPAYTDVFLDEALELAREDKRIVTITAAMLEGTGLIKFLKEFPDRCYDVGMAEQHAVGMAQGLALSGQKPICAVYSTFMQRAIDQLFQEIALINTPVLFCLDRAGLVGPDGATHNGVFDIAYCRMLPNMVVMAPRDGGELRSMMRLGLEHPGPCAIRYPRTQTPLKEHPVRNFKIGEAELLQNGQAGCLFAYGAMVYPALDAAQIILKRHGVQLAVVNARFAKPLDQRTLEREFSRQPRIFTLEDHVLSGGFGSAVLEYANQLGLESTKLEIIAIGDHFVDHSQRSEALASASLDVESIVQRVEKSLNLQESELASKRDIE